MRWKKPSLWICWICLFFFLLSGCGDDDPVEIDDHDTPEVVEDAAPKQDCQRDTATSSGELTAVIDGNPTPPRCRSAGGGSGECSRGSGRPARSNLFRDVDRR